MMKSKMAKQPPGADVGKLKTITRRGFMLGSVVITGGVAFGYWKYKEAIPNPLTENLSDREVALTPYVMINGDGITVVAPRAEMGQGVHTTLAALVAEELDVTLEQVTVIHGPASRAYFNKVGFEEVLPFAAIDRSAIAEGMREFLDVPAKLLGMQMTGGSSSVADAYDKMRLAGAAARGALLQAAANTFGAPEATLTTVDGKVISSDGQKLTYSELALSAAQVEMSAESKLKPRSEWRVLGKSQTRVDIIPKSTGKAMFGLDVSLPNLLYATVKVNPNLSSPMRSYDARKAIGMQGVREIIEITNGVAVVATNTWYAFQAANAIEFDWAPAKYSPSTDGLRQLIADSFEGFRNSKYRDDGDVEAVLSDEEVVSGEYQVPYLAHAAMEPMNATAWFKGGELEIWAGNQLPTEVLKSASALTGLDEERIKVHVPFLGGGFGRRLEIDFVNQAVEIAKAMEGTPVKLTWTREEDTRHDYYRPMAIARFRGRMGDRIPTALDLQLAAPSVLSSQFGRLGYPIVGPDASIVQAAWDQPYSIEHYRVRGYKAETEFPVSSWRSVGASQNAFFHECMIDELANSVGVDPLKMRLDMISHEPSRKVLEAVRMLSKWDSPLPEGHGRGVAFCMSFGVPTAEVVEVAEQDGKIRIVNAYIAADVGTALDPRNLEAQFSGAFHFGLAAAMMSEITITDGKVDQSNFHDYDSIRMHQSPNVEVVILENGDRIRGAGEPGTPPAAPALANAIFSVTNKRIRKLPLNKEISFV